MDYNETKKEVIVKVYTIKGIVENAFDCNDSLEDMDRVLYQIDKQVREGRELIKKLSYSDRVASQWGA